MGSLVQIHFAAVRALVNRTSVTRAAEAPISDDPKRVEEAARQFESLLIAQLLRTAREAGGAGWMGTGDDPTASSAMEMAEEQFAKALTAAGGIGLSRMVVEGLQTRSEPRP